MQTKPLGKMFQISNCMKCLPLYLTIKYIYTAEKKYKEKKKGKNKKINQI